MDKQVQKISPDYKKIYTDIIEEKFPHKKNELLPLLTKNILNTIDILELNDKIFNTVDKPINLQHQNHRSYQKSDIFLILDYQKKHQLNNSQLAQHFSLSRNTVSKWKKIFF